MENQSTGINRRRMLQAMGLAAGAAWSPLGAWANPSDKDRASHQGTTLRVALMGLGSYAAQVAEAMQSCKRAKVAGLISGTPSKLQEWGTKFGVPEKSR